MRYLVGLCAAFALVIDLSFRLQPLPAGASEPLRQGTSGPGPRSGHSMVYDPERGRLIIVDGYLPPHDSSPGELWSWDGRRWTLVSGPGAAPSKRIVGAAAFDTRRKRLVSFGGSHSVRGALGDTWEWDRLEWKELADTSVGRRDHHLLAYDEARGATVLFAGNWGPPPWPRDTWEWNGVSWTRAATDGPIGRSRSGMVYDSKRQQMVLFGGAGMPAGPKQPFIMFGDTWVWKSGAWRELPGQSPPARYAHAMAFDSRRGIVVLYGGATMSADGQTAHLEDMWQWNGERWSEIKLTGSTPGKRYSPAMAYDASRDRVVLHGGLEARGRGDFIALEDVWEWDGSRWMLVK